MKPSKLVPIVILAAAALCASAAAAVDYTPATPSTGLPVLHLFRIPAPVGVRVVREAWGLEAGRDVLDLELVSPGAHPGVVFVMVQEITVDAATGATTSCGRAFAHWDAPPGSHGRFRIRLYGLERAKAAAYRLNFAASNRNLFAGDRIAQ